MLQGHEQQQAGCAVCLSAVYQARPMSAGSIGQIGSSLACAGPRMPSLLCWELAFTAAAREPSGAIQKHERVEV